MKVVYIVLVIVVVLALIGILYNASRVYHKLYTITYRSTKNPLLRALKSGFRSLVFVFLHLDGSSYPYDG